MEAIGLASSIIALLELGKKLHEVGKTVMGKLPDVIVTSTIVRDLQTMQECLETNAKQISKETGNELRDACSELELSLAGCLDRCTALQAGMQSRKQRLMSVLHGETTADVKKSIRRIEREVADLKERFSMKGILRIETAVTRASALNEQFREEMNQRLDFIEEHLKLRIHKAEANPAYADSLVGIAQMSGSTMQSSLQRASTDLEQSASGVEAQYLRVKIQALQEALISQSPSPTDMEQIEPSNTSGTTHQYPVDDPTNQIEDTILKSIALLRVLRAPGGKGKQLPFLVIIAGLEDLCKQMLDLGMYEDSRQTYSQVIRMYRAFIQDEDPPSQIDARLAGAIIGLCAALGRLGHPDEALERIQEAVDIFRYLFQHDGGAYKAELSVALNNMANYSRDADQHLFAVRTINEAIKLREELAARAPELYKPDLAASLLNGSTCLSKLPYLHEQALEVAARAVCIAEELARDHPGQFAAHVGAALHNRANRRLARWQSLPAYNDIKKAVAIRRELAATRPDVYRGGLIRSLTVAKVLARQCQDNSAEAAFRDELQSLCKQGGADYNDILVNVGPVPQIAIPLDPHEHLGRRFYRHERWSINSWRATSTDWGDGLVAASSEIDRWLITPCSQHHLPNTHPTSRQQSEWWIAKSCRWNHRGGTSSRPGGLRRVGWRSWRA